MKLLLGLLLGSAAASAGAAPLSFAEAMARLEAEAPALRAAGASQRAAEAGLGEAGRRPNPTAEVEVENFAGSGPFRRFDGTEVTALIEQPIELGGKRRARVAAARAELALALAERASERRRLLAELVRSYAGAAASRARLALAEEEAGLARTLAEQSRRRLAAGDIAEVEHDRVLVALGQAEAAHERAASETEAAERSLAVLLGLSEPVQADARFLQPGQADPAAVSIITAGDDRLRAIAERGRARVAAARAERTPDLAARGGVRLSREEEAVGLVAGLSLPLPLFNPGRARVAQAEAEAEQAALQAEVQQRDARRTAARALGNWRSAVRTLALIDQRTLPAAERLVALTERGHRLGALPFRDLADARSSLLGARQSRLDALEQIASAKADLAEVTGAFGSLGLTGAEASPEGD